MALEKVTYVDNETVITAKNLNDIQDEIIANGQAIENGPVAPTIKATYDEETQTMVFTNVPKEVEDQLYAPSGYGLGEKTSRVTNDLDAVVEFGYYQFGADADNNPFGAAGYMTVSGTDEWTLKQEAEFFTGSVPVSYYRYKHAGVWKEWIPTVDVIVEQGTSGSWIYRKWASGIAECWGVFRDGTLSTTQEGSLYYALTTAKAYPFIFTENPFVQVSPASDGNGYCMVVAVHESGTASQTPIYALARPNNATLYNSSLSLHAIGKWK